MLNRSEIEELVFDDCRHPFIFQVTDGYRFFRLAFFLCELLYAAFGSYLVFRARNSKGVTIRSLYSFIFYIFGFIVNAFAFSLTEFHANRISLLNQCEVHEALAVFSIVVFLMTLTMRVTLYYNGYKLYKAVVEVTEESKGVKASTVDGSENPSLSSLFYRASPEFASKFFSFCCFVTTLVPLISIGISCPQEFLPPVSCSEQRDSDAKTIVKYLVLGLVVLLFLVVVTVKTKGYPDPFFIIKEAKVAVMVYSFFYMVAIVSITIIHPTKFTNLVITPTLFISIFSVTAFTILVVYPAYRGLKAKIVTMSLQQVLANKSAKKLFKKHLSNELTLKAMRVMPQLPC